MSVWRMDSERKKHMASNCISQQDFLAIREEILELIPARFDRLCRTADALLRPYVMSRTSHVRSDPNFAQDVLQDIQMKLIQSIVTRFFLREDRPEEDKTALGLTRWMFAIARNTTLTHLTASSQRIPVSLLQDSDDEEYELPLPDDHPERQPGEMLEQREAVSEVFRFIIDSGSAGHIVLAVLMVSLIALESGGSRIEAERLFVQNFADKPLDDILGSFRRGVQKKPWLNISDNQLSRFQQKLDAPLPDDGRRSGDCPLKDFSMKKGLEPSLSDWLNRMDSRLKKAFPNYADPVPANATIHTR